MEMLYIRSLFRNDYIEHYGALIKEMWQRSEYAKIIVIIIITIF
jgi:hypothetical protein